MLIEVLHGRLKSHTVEFVGDRADQFLRDDTVDVEDLRHHLFELARVLVDLLEVGVVRGYDLGDALLRGGGQLAQLLLEGETQLRDCGVDRGLETAVFLVQFGEGALGHVALLVKLL